MGKNIVVVAIFFVLVDLGSTFHAAMGSDAFVVGGKFDLLNR